LKLHGNTATSIVLIFVAAWVSTSCQHAGPYAVFWRPSHAVALSMFRCAHA
jgi:hypothetical protein